MRDSKPDYTNEDLLAMYMITGGVAKYVEQLVTRGALTKDEIIRDALSVGSYFLDEGQEMLRDEFGKDYGNYFSILSALATGETSRGEIKSYTGVEAGGYLDKLESDYGIIARRRPYLAGEKSKNVEYKLTPPSRSINYTKTAVAFANGQGGCLVFGVEDQTLHAIYDDRLEITSPGRLPMGQTIERMKQGYSKIRNEALASAFEYMGYIEHWGSGILRVMQEVRDAGLPEPEFLGGDTDLRINIYRNGSETGSDDGIVTGLRRDSLSDDGIAEGTTSKTNAAPNAAIAVLPSQKERILDALRRNASISISDAIRILGVQERQAQRILKSLIEEGSAVKIGAARATRYAEAMKRTEPHE